jgi:YbbR domain-containing protein
MHWLRHNWQLKLVALGLASLTWMFVRGITSGQRTIREIPLEIRVRPGMVLEHASASTVDITLRGAHDAIRQVSRLDVLAILDLTGDARTGEWTTRLGSGAIRVPEGVQVADVQPSQIRVRVDELVEKEMNVHPRLVGEVAQGFAIERVIVRPRTVRVTGPRALLENLPSVETLPIDVTGRRASFRERVEIEPLEFGNGVGQRRAVEVDVRIVEATPPGPPAPPDNDTNS